MLIKGVTTNIAAAAARTRNTLDLSSISCPVAEAMIRAGIVTLTSSLEIFLLLSASIMPVLCAINPTKMRPNRMIIWVTIINPSAFFPRKKAETWLAPVPAS
ncbi:hypothetical protein D3C73_1186790 [compost metagenome]